KPISWATSGTGRPPNERRRRSSPNATRPASARQARKRLAGRGGVLDHSPQRRGVVSTGRGSPTGAPTSRPNSAGSGRRHRASHDLAPASLRRRRVALFLGVGGTRKKPTRRVRSLPSGRENSTRRPFHTPGHHQPGGPGHGLDRTAERRAPGADH